MEKAIIFSVIFILALLGLHKIVESLMSLVTAKGKSPAVIFYKIENDKQNAELIIRSLAAETHKVSSGKRAAVYIVTDGADTETLEISQKTADQLSNVFVGNFSDGAFLLKEDIT